MSEQIKTIFEPEKPNVPSNWSIAPFKDVVEIVSDQGKRIKKRDYLEQGSLPVIDQGQDFIGGYINDDSMVYEGDLPVIVFGDHTRAVKFVNQSFAVGADGVKLLRPTECFDPKFLYYLLRSLQVPSRGYSRHFQFLKKFHLPIAPLAQQTRIVAEIEKQFSRLDDAVANLKRVKANLKRYKAAVLKAAVEGKLTEEWRKQHPDVEPADKLLERILEERRANWQGKGKYKEPVAPDTSGLPELPKGWVWAKTDQLFSFVTSGSRGWARYYSPTGPIFLRMGNLDHDTIALDLSDTQRVNPPKGSEGTRTRIQAGDILVSITADVGMVWIVPKDFEEAYINQHVALARPTSLDISVYLAWFLACKGGQDQLNELQRGATKVGLGLEDIKSVCVPLPPLTEQRTIMAEIERRLSIVADADAQVDANLRRADRLSQSILKRAFSGNLIT